jgi:hypothetical protein
MSVVVREQSMVYSIRILLVMVGIVSAAVLGDAYARDTRMSGKELRTLLVGRTIDVRTAKGGEPIVKFGQDGRYCRTVVERFTCDFNDDEIGWAGPWRIHKNKLCLTHPKSRSESCYGVFWSSRGNFKLIGSGNLQKGTFSIRSS